MTDPASQFRAMYLQHCEACARAGVPAPTPEEWVELLDERIREAGEKPRSPDPIE